MPRKTAPVMPKETLELLSEFRYRLRHFLRFSEEAAKEAGITVLQYQVLVHLGGFPGRDWATISELAERLQSQPHGVVALITRCEDLGLVRRVHSVTDRRQVEVHMTARGRKCLDMLAARHWEMLPALAQALHALGDDLGGKR
ncbi:MarR family transcriptional regulator [Imbroritus primus]|uniref:MarR family transcriptional regulator n=1 Tax=Imbroritus primus TaxID=3058603 RepID=A0ACD3SK59_9BURK|nr:MarR family transcriptional regulator [Burkholderiaceae bacterium PBA]